MSHIQHILLTAGGEWHAAFCRKPKGRPFLTIHNVNADDACAAAKAAAGLLRTRFPDQELPVVCGVHRNSASEPEWFEVGVAERFFAVPLAPFLTDRAQKRL